MIYEVNSNDPKEGILMSDKNNNVMMNNNMNNDNDPKERMRKKVKKAAGIALCAVLAGGLAAGSFEGINTIPHFFRQNQKRRVPIRSQIIKKAKMIPNQRQKEVLMFLILLQKE